MRKIVVSEPNSGLAASCELLDQQAPLSAEFLWQLASRRSAFEANHAMWTGPELSCPLPASVLPASLSGQVLPSENATSYPEAGEIVLASLTAGSIKGLPPGNFFDLGLFYGAGGRLLMPFGWIMANVCARVAAEDFTEFQAAMKTIRRNGTCTLTLECG